LGIGILVYEINQNTRATEAEVAWAHTSTSNELYYERAKNTELLDFVLEMKVIEILSGHR
jgi:hypothetical protein